ncbi:GntR family transcriptional regulator [Microcella sp.]|uniref:GntR family transcriptional regulator n=1 Tax=Microcella sp. TaxID=1913979 RepID=UPI00391C20AC
MAKAKYLEILDSLRTRCASMPIGARLDSERTLAGQFGVSVMTVRHSLDHLVEEGWAKKLPGSGTYVSRPTISMGPSLTSFSEDMRQRGFTPSSRVMRVETVRPDVATIGVLSLRPGESAVLVERLRSADNEPMCHEVSLFPPSLAPFLLSADLSGSIHELLAGHSITPHSVERAVRAVQASNRESDLLELPRGCPALEIVDTFYDSLGRPMQHVLSRYRFDRYEVRSDIHRA